MKFFDEKKMLDGFVIVLVALLVAWIVLTISWRFWTKSTCSLCKERHPSYQVTAINADNNVTFNMCRKCALEVFKDKIEKE